MPQAENTGSIRTDLLMPLSVILWPFLTSWQWFLWLGRYMQLSLRLPAVPGIPLIGMLLDFQKISTKGLLAYFMDIYENHMLLRSIMSAFLGPMLFVFSKDPTDNEKVLTGQSFMDKGKIYKNVLEPWLGTGLLTSSGEKWRTRRKMLTPAFHFKILDQFIPIFHSCSDEFINQMRKHVGGESFDVCTYMRLLTLDVICETAMGIKMNAQINSTSEYVTAVNELTMLTTDRIMKPWLNIDFIFRFTSIGRRYRKVLSVLHNTTDKVIKQRRHELEKMGFDDLNLDADELGRRRRVAFLDLLLLSSRDGSLSDLDIREEVDTFMFEGHDTTSSGLSFAIYMLSQHPDVQEKIYKELKEHFDTSQPLHPSIMELSQLKYLEMVIKESLRLYTPVPAIVRSIKEEFAIPSTEHQVPSGSSFLVAPYALHRNADLYPDPHKFDPERFSAEQCALRHPFAYLPFSAGSRNCIGQRFAILEMKSVLAKLVWNFRVLPKEGFEPIVIWEIVLKSENGLHVRLEDRQRESE